MEARRREKRERGGLGSPRWHVFGMDGFVDRTGRGRAFDAEAEEVDGKGNGNGWEGLLGVAASLFV